PIPICGSSGASTTISARRSAVRPNCSSIASCARTAACSTCYPRTTPSSTNAWPSTMESPTCTEAGSVEWNWERALIAAGSCAMGNYDAVGRWRTHENGKPIDAAGGLPDGSKFDGVAGLQKALLSHPEVFVNTMTEKLLTYSLGRGVEYYDAPAVRGVVRESRDKNYRFSALVLGIVNSTPFQMRRTQ